MKKCWTCRHLDYDDGISYCHRRIVFDAYGEGCDDACEAYESQQKKPLCQATDSEDETPF